MPASIEGGASTSGGLSATGVPSDTTTLRLVACDALADETSAQPMH
jgi:hypothetical protein